MENRWGPRGPFSTLMKACWSCDQRPPAVSVLAPNAQLTVYHRALHKRSPSIPAPPDLNGRRANAAFSAVFSDAGGGSDHSGSNNPSVNSKTNTDGS